VVEVSCEGGGGGQVFKVLCEYLPARSAALSVLYAVEEAFEDVVRSFDKTDPSAVLLWNLHVMSPQVVAVSLKVAKDDVDGLTKILGRASLGTALEQRLGEVHDGLSDVA